MEAATARISSQAFLARNEIASPAARNTKLAIAPTRPGRMAPILLPKSFKPSPTFLPTVFMPFAAALAPSASILARTPILMPTAVTTVAMVKPYFLKRFFSRFQRGSLSSIYSLSCSSWFCSCSSWFCSCSSWASLSVFSVVLSRAQPRTEGCSFSSFATFISSLIVLLSSSRC